MKILITGSGGQLGQQWIDFCKEESIHFKSYRSTELDITDPKKVLREIQSYNPDIIINCAAYTKVDNAEEEKKNAQSVNATAVHDLALLCKKLDIKLVHFSTDYVFAGEEEDRSKLPDGYPEVHTRNPINEYGYSKYLGEKAIEESGCEYLLIRVSWLCGKHGQNFVKTMLRLGKEKENLSIVNDQFGSPTFTDQVVELTHILIQNKETGAFHISSEGLISWYDFAKEIFNQSGIRIDVKPVTSDEYPTKAKRPSFSKLSTQKISNIDGVNIIHWKEGLQKMLNQL